MIISKYLAVEKCILLNKRLNTDLDVSPVGIFTLSDISVLMDRKLSPIIKQLGIVEKSFELEHRVKTLEAKNKSLQERLIKQELYSRRENIKILGIKEESNED